MESAMKLLIITSIALAFAGAAYADPSAEGLEHGQRLGWYKKNVTPTHSVPDAGSTLGLLGLGMASLAFWRLKLA